MSDDEENFETATATGGSSVSGGFPMKQICPLPTVPPNQGPPSVPLAYLIDFAVQRTFQDLTVLAELLPKKSDMERKISIVQFAHSTRQLFIRLLAVVKWAKSVSKVDLCTGITYFLDQQAAMFVETADRLFQLSREVLPQARLPAFQIPAAVDVLVLGSYPRLPACVKTRFVPDDAITLKEQACVLRRLNQVIQHRLIFSMVPLPARMQDFTIRNGMVKFTVPGEFEASLTLLGEDPDLPWSLLNIKILVEDYEIGEGADLVHPFQVHYLHELVEARMLPSDNPIAELYDVLHSFCIYLQLDILFCQASKFVHDRMIEYISVDEYVQGNRLTITYWKSASKRPHAAPTTAQHQASTIPGFNYKITIHVDSNEKKKALRASHVPGSDVRLPTLDDYGGKLNVENLLCDTIVVRIRFRLSQLQQRLGDTFVKNSRIVGKVPTLEIPLLEPLVEVEKLNVAINLFTGHFVCSVDLLGKIRVLDEMERLLNLAQWHKIGEKLFDLKMVLLMERCHKTVVGLPVVITDSVPLLPASTIFRSLSRHRLLLRFSRHEAFYLVVEFLPEGKCNCKIRYFLLSTCSASSLSTSMPVDKNRETTGVCEFIKPVNMLLLDANAGNEYYEPPEKRTRTKSHLASEFAALVIKCDQRIPFSLLYDEFDRKGIKYQLVRAEPGVGCVVVNVLGFTAISAADKEVVDALWSDSIVNVSGRLMHDRNHVHWTFEIITCNIPLVGLHQRHSYGSDEEHHVRVNVTNTAVSSDGAARCADELINTICSFARLYNLITRFAPAYKSWMNQLCQVFSLTANRLVLSYGPSEKQYFIMLQWKQQESSFHMAFGTHVSGGSATSVDGRPNFVPTAENPHQLMLAFVQTSFNEKRDLAYLMQYLCDTIEPLAALHQLPQSPVFGVGENQMQPVGYGHSFTILPISATVVRVIYKSQACFEMIILADGEVILRDCGAVAATSSGSQQSPAKLNGRFSPIVGFKSFFSLHEQLVGNSLAATIAPTPGSVSVQPIDTSPTGMMKLEKS